MDLDQVKRKIPAILFSLDTYYGVREGEADALNHLVACGCFVNSAVNQLDNLCPPSPVFQC